MNVLQMWEKQKMINLPFDTILPLNNKICFYKIEINVFAISIRITNNIGRYTGKVGSTFY